MTPVDERRFYRFLIRTVFVLVSAGSLIALLGEWFWFAELFTHFRLYYLIIQALLILIFLYGGHRALVVMTVLLAMPNAWVVGPYLKSLVVETSEAAVADAGIRIVSLNINFQNNEFSRATEYLTETDPDIIILSEFTPEWFDELESLRESHVYQLTDAHSDPWGLAVFSRLPFVDAELIDLAQAGAVNARFVVEAGPGHLEIFAVHLYKPTSSDEARIRNRQLEDLADYLVASRHRRLVIGDMNLTPFSPYFSRLTDRTGLLDARRVDGIHVTWPTSSLPIWIPIDHALADPSVNVTRVRKGPDIGSDHFPLEVFLADRVAVPGKRDIVENE